MPTPKHRKIRVTQRILPRCVLGNNFVGLDGRAIWLLFMPLLPYFQNVRRDIVIIILASPSTVSVSRSLAWSMQKDHHQSTRPEQALNGAETRKQQSSSKDEVGLVLQHVFCWWCEWIHRYTLDHWLWCYKSHLQWSQFVRWAEKTRTAIRCSSWRWSSPTKHRGSVHLRLKVGSLTRRCKVHNVLFIPRLDYCLLSISKAVEKGVQFIFN